MISSSKFVDPFIANCPTIDLHGETTAFVPILLDEFINDNIKIRNLKLVVIHGLGSGKVKEATHNYLQENKKIKKYYLSPNNIGITIIEI